MNKNNTLSEHLQNAIEKEANLIPTHSMTAHFPGLVQALL